MEGGMGRERGGRRASVNMTALITRLWIHGVTVHYPCPHAGSFHLPAFVAYCDKSLGPEEPGNKVNCMLH